MPDRYWVGSTATWDGTAGTKWSATSGGPGGASVPTIDDDVFFDASSNTANNITVLMAGISVAARSINCTGFTRTLSGTANITVAGGITLSSGMTYTHTGTVTLTGTGTLTTAGKTFSAVTVDGPGITVTLGDALNIGTRTLLVTQGTFNTNNFSIQAGSLNSSSAVARTLNLGSSTITLSTGISILNSASLTINAGTSQINLTSTAATLAVPGTHTFHNVAFTSNIYSATGRTLGGTNATSYTFNNLSFTVPTASAITLFSIAVQTTIINGTFTCNGSIRTARAFIFSSILGQQRSFVANTNSISNCDFRDISGGAISPVGAGDCGGNAGITFPASKIVYRVGTNINWTNSTSWALTSGGTGNIDNYPLPQDYIIIDNNTTLTGTLSVASYNIGTFDCSLRTNALTINNGTASQTFYGGYILGPGISLSGTVNQTFSGRGFMSIDCAGKTIPFPISVDTPSGTFRLTSAFTSSNTITLLSGAVNANNNNVTCQAFRSNNTSVRTLTMGSGLWTITGVGTGASAPWSLQDTNMTVNVNSANILLSDTSTSARQFSGGTGVTYNRLTIGGTTGTSTTTISGGITINELASTKTVAHTVNFTANLNINNWLITGTAGNVVTVGGGGVRTITLANVTNNINYLSVSQITIPSPNRFYVGPNSTDGGSNTNVIFTATPAGGQPTSNMLLLF